MPNTHISSGTYPALGRWLVHWTDEKYRVPANASFSFKAPPVVEDDADGVKYYNGRATNGSSNAGNEWVEIETTTDCYLCRYKRGYMPPCAACPDTEMERVHVTCGQHYRQIVYALSNWPQLLTLTCSYHDYAPPGKQADAASEQHQIRVGDVVVAAPTEDQVHLIRGLDANFVLVGRWNMRACWKCIRTHSAWWTSSTAHPQRIVS